MKSIRSLSLRLLVTAAAFLAANAHAQLFRAYLASTGSDANPCTIAAPCRLLPAALNAVASGGEIWMLDSANYNTATVTISKSVTILAIPGATASVVVTGGGSGIDINASGAAVALRNLVILPALGGGTSGVLVTAGDRVSVEDCLIYGLGAGAAIHVATAANVKVTGSTLRDNQNGVLAENLALVDIAGTKILGNSSHGILVNALAAGATTVTVFDSVLSHNGIGARAFSSAAGAAGRLYANRVTAASNASSGLASEASGSGAALLSVGNSMIDKNAVGIVQSGAGAVARSTGDNYVADNTVNVTGTLSALALR